LLSFTSICLHNSSVLQLIINVNIEQKHYYNFMLKVGSSLLFNPQYNSEPYLEKMLPSRHPCHTWDSRLGISCEVVRPNFYASQWLRLHGVTSSELGLRTWDLVWTNPH
jgi:hypothetical protein